MTDPIDEDHLAGLPSLCRRLSRKIETRKGVQLSPADLDLLVLSGAYETLCAATGAYQKAQSAQRAAQPRQTTPPGGHTGQGRETAAEALARAQRKLAPRSKEEDMAYIAALTANA